MIYPRTVEIHRVKTVAGSGSPGNIGLTGYSGTDATTNPADPQGETVRYTGIPASIQAGSARARRGAQSTLPQDAVINPMWDIFIPLTAVPKGAIRDRDIIVDDEGYRYEVGQAYWNLLGYKCLCIRLEA